MARKNLNQIGLPDEAIEGLSETDPRQQRWKQQIKDWGFADYETWNMNFMFFAWLYERLKVFLEVNCIDLEFHKYELDGEVYTQLELINKMIEGCEIDLTGGYGDCYLEEEKRKKMGDVVKIWAVVFDEMWW